jgi:chromosome segregation ATPase
VPFCNYVHMGQDERVTELESALEREKQDRADAEERATRANERARQSDEAFRKLQLELVAAKDEASAARDEAKNVEDKLALLDAEVARLRDAAITAAAKPSMAPPAPAPAAPAASPTVERSAEVTAQVEHMLQRIEGLREMLASASIELSQLHADEVALHKKRSRTLTDACAVLARAVGATGKAPPPIPSASLEARLSIAPVVDISEVADLIESLRPPRAPKVE